MMLQSFDPASRALIWEGPVADAAACNRAIATARAALPGWRACAVEERIAIARRYALVLEERRAALAELISRETGKLLWESDAEIGSMIAKVEVSIAAHAERTGERAAAMNFGRAVLRHRGHGVMAVLGPYNFPGHLPNGHIVPALIAGNAVVFKPSEIAPATGAAMADAWAAAGLPDGLLNVVQGGRATGEALVAGNIDGLLFTGSAGAGAALRRALVDRPHVIMALELGGNNPLIAWDSPDEAASIIINSAFITTGQRCSCARRLIVPEGAVGDRIVAAADGLAALLPIAAWNEPGDAFMGPLVSDQAAAAAHRAVSDLVARGARVIRPFAAIDGRSAAFVTPGIIDMTGVDGPDAEIFAPLLSVIRVPDFDAAMKVANATAFGLSAGLISQDATLWERMVEESRAGVVNRNRPTTGAAGNMPFGGLGASGNHCPSAYYAADYCAYPIASFEADGVQSVPVNGLA
ncbi:MULTISPECIES: succinylglutamate-semialdehyde dehydrogenase [unclassified Sphingobium]|uniref:succinylglutamate-semialdehyde dehydrogenase n=1 Tax=unclassified Sphingobium TaxID=2611147 RepID=UPI000D15BAB9|nr:MULTISPECIES: succinylglutamate-semialdehyde dehydrogenase [unclassified Sphingobium]MBG6116321.1 succinylglutamic semialdehyde dehydrogenase [Sphingobium sp. JAI105]PSO13142.1 succinylglutamate-semialdehyde dehydrogenase [Sphingobium sp. AEW4]TWD11353.1 succinylglutamic semialdehyde dehydrogenase [Sphingobium sp. AEW010]TWD28756.1 succinylglutamic semialdehyde dehydrogenase [Sphingobium sp. AEW013]TWD29895.1 succinylglutamic semialdehyde dehydrogenase [Sphingobium sp. AEW001]